MRKRDFSAESKPPCPCISYKKELPEAKGYTHIECYSKLSGKNISEERFSSDGGAPLCHCVTSPRTAGSHPEPLFQRLYN